MRMMPIPFSKQSLILWLVGLLGGTMALAQTRLDYSDVFDVSKAVYADANEELYIGSQENNPEALTFNSYGAVLSERKTQSFYNNLIANRSESFRIQKIKKIIG